MDKRLERIKEIVIHQYETICNLMDYINELEAKLPEDRICSLCDNKKRLYFCEFNGSSWIKANDGKWNNNGISIKDNYLVYDNSNGKCDPDRIPIKYCPLCGKKLL